ncbi:hypothetical protein ATANTOWER_032174 [Ataeniobius toweri]|uniref:Uncharacterized protein n=1 Tax=Ataeniobius toweri TaxID=208326 RepID=A0ABU7AIA4_9TELE|nr:hypothetical protein [Ataeniobius toweri]
MTSRKAKTILTGEEGGTWMEFIRQCLGFPSFSETLTASLWIKHTMNVSGIQTSLKSAAVPQKYEQKQKGRTYGPSLQPVGIIGPVCMWATGRARNKTRRKSPAGACQ